MFNKKVYISGPMNNMWPFQEAMSKLKAAGFTVVSKLNICLDDGMSVKDKALIQIAALSTCDYIYQLDGWQDDDSATAEWFMAQWMGLLVVNESWLDWYVNELKRRKERNEKEREKEDDESSHQKA